MTEVQDDLLKDIEAVRQISIVPSMLEVICQTTGMGFAAIARVTSDRWVACKVRDEVNFGLEEGGELEVETTLCNEVRAWGKAVVIDNFEEDPNYKHHHTPKIYGLQSYISVPIFLKNGTFFGTLCAIDSRPAKVNNKKIIGTFTMFAELLAFHLQSLDLLERSYQETIQLLHNNKALAQVNEDLDTFVYTASHDLKSPVKNIEGLLNALSKAVDKDPIDRAKVNQIIAMMKTSLERLGLTMEDLATIVEADRDSESENSEAIDLDEMVKLAKQDLDQQIEASGAKIKVSSEEKLRLNFSKKNFRSIIQNLLSNAIKYHSPERKPEIQVKLYKDSGRIKLSVTDNGLGIPAEKQDQVFTLFNRFHEHVEGSGIGLYIVKRMVDKCAGEIKVESKLNEGTTFTITF